MPIKPIQWDSYLIQIINGAHNPFLDQLFWIISNELTVLLFLALLSYYSLSIRRIPIQKYLWLIGFLILTIILSDHTASSLFKPLIGRLRPSHEPAIQELLHFVNIIVAGSMVFILLMPPIVWQPWHSYGDLSIIVGYSIFVLYGFSL